MIPPIRSNAYYGWVKQLPDHRDYVYTAPLKLTFPELDSLRPSMPKRIYNQLNLGSCTANASLKAVDFERLLQGLLELDGSRLFAYFNARAMEGTIASDAGAQLRDVIKSLAKQGVCPESEWPYDIAKFSHVPNPQCYADAVKHLTLNYVSIIVTPERSPELYGFQYQINQRKRPVIFGFTVYESFESDEVAKTGLVPMPKMGEKVLGGHAVLACGYDNNRRLVECCNSWGPDWGDAGYFWLPYQYFNDPDLCGDFWQIRLEE